MDMEINGTQIDWTGHSGFLIKIPNGTSKTLFIDPFGLSENAATNKADIILITHSHYDHCSIRDIDRIIKPGTKIIIPADVQSKITRIEGVEMQVVEVGDELDIMGIKIQALPAYNVDKEFHTKADAWLGYLIKTNGVIIYHSGDSDKIKEMEKLTGYGRHGNNFIALLPVSGKYVMTAEEAAETAELINPDVAVPMHYGSGVVGTIDDANRFVEICKQEGVHAEILEKI